MTFSKQSKINTHSKINWTGAKYISINLNWDYEKQKVKLSTKGYVE